MDNLPVCKKCCFCMPLRYGLLVWGYLKLASALVALSFFIFLVAVLSRFLRSNDVLIISIISLIGLILASEIVFHIIFIIGAHKKIVKLLKVYYYYALFMWVVTIKVAIVGTAFLVLSLVGVPSHGQSAIITLDVISFIFSIIVQTFLILSLRSEIIKLRSNCPYRFVKNDNDPEGTVNSVKEDDVSMDNTTVRIL